MFLRGFDDFMKNLGIGVRSFTSNLLESLTPRRKVKIILKTKKTLKALLVSCMEVGQTYVQSVSPLQSSNSVAIF
jgi:hypothetical protein